VGYGLEKQRRICSNSHGHHWMRRAKGVDGKDHVVPVRLSLPLPSDFCSRCRVVRDQLEAS
jgi:hypothetical protein